MRGSEKQISFEIDAAVILKESQLISAGPAERGECAQDMASQQIEALRSRCRDPDPQDDCEERCGDFFNRLLGELRRIDEKRPSVAIRGRGNDTRGPVRSRSLEEDLHDGYLFLRF